MNEQRHYLVKITSHVAEKVVQIDGTDQDKMSEEHALVGKIAAGAVIAAMATGLSDEDNAVELIIEKLTRDAVEEKLIAYRSDNVSVLTPKVIKRKF